MLCAISNTYGLTYYIRLAIYCVFHAYEHFCTFFSCHDRLTLFELGLANDYLVRDKGCYLGQEIVSRTLRRMDVQHTKQMRASTPMPASSPGVFRQRLRGYVVRSKGLVKRGNRTTIVEGTYKFLLESVSLSLLSMCAC